MPNAFSLTPKGSSATERLAAVDEKMALAFNAPVHPDLWFGDWYNRIGFSLSVGRTLDDLRNLYKEPNGDPELIKIINWLDDNYTVSAWYSPH